MDRGSFLRPAPLEFSCVHVHCQTVTQRRVEDHGDWLLHLECKNTADCGMSRLHVLLTIRHACDHREASPCRSCLLYVILSQLPPFVTLGREERNEVENPDKFGGHIPLSHVLWLVDDVFRMGTEHRPQVYVPHTIRTHLVVTTCSSSVPVYLPVHPRSAPAPQILHIGYDVAFGCKVAAGDETLDVTVLTIGNPPKDHKEAALIRLHHAHEVSAELHDLDMDQRLAWLSRGIPLWICDKGSHFDDREDRDGDRRPIPGSQHSTVDTQPTAPKDKTPRKSPTKSSDAAVPLTPDSTGAAETVLPGEQHTEPETPEPDLQQTPRKTKRGDTGIPPKGPKRPRKRSKSAGDKVADEHADQHPEEHASDTPNDEEDEIKVVGEESEPEPKRSSPRKHSQPSRYGEAEAHAAGKRSSSRTSSTPSSSAPKGQTSMAIKLATRLGGGLRKPPGGNE